MERLKEEGDILTNENVTFDPGKYDLPEGNDADLEPFYGSLKNYVRMVVKGYSNMLMLDAPGGLGKTHNVLEVLKDELDADEFTHLKGFTTPIELYKSLYMAQERGHILFLDDMSGVTSNTKAVDMLKAATDTEGEENWVQYRTSQDIDHPARPGQTLPNTFCFRGRVIMSFNEVPDNRHFSALQDRGVFHQLQFTYDERLSLIREISKIPDFSTLTVTEQKEVAEWVADVTDPSMEVTIRTFEEVCQMRSYGQLEGEDWEKMALEVFGVDYHKYLIIRMRSESDMSVEEQVKYFKEETGKSQSYYYDTLSTIRDERS